MYLCQYVFNTKQFSAHNGWFLRLKCTHVLPGSLLLVQQATNFQAAHVDTRVAGTAHHLLTSAVGSACCVSCQVGLWRLQQTLRQLATQTACWCHQ
jgi:hypothetical protein